MDFIDYREKLGLGFNDEQKFQLFQTRIFNALSVNGKGSSGSITYDEYYSFCMETGSKINSQYIVSHMGRDRFENCIRILSYHKNTMSEFLSYLVWFANSIHTQKRYESDWNREKYANFIMSMLNECHISFDLLEEDDKFFVFPKGAKELDNVLVSDVLTWLQRYPKAHKTYCTALKQYAEGIYIRDTADNFRKALEEFCQEFLSNTKNLANNITEVFQYLGKNNAEPEVASMMKSLMNTYDTLNNKIAKHNDKVDEKYLEFLMYQTGVFIRMLIVVDQASKGA